MRRIVRWLLIGIAGLLVMLLVLVVAFFVPDIPVDRLRAKYVNGASRFAMIQGMEVHYRDEGPQSDSVPLVLLHGTSSSLLTWDACAAEWSKDFRVIRMDLPGFGLTGPNASNDYGLNMYRSFLDDFLKHLEITRCVMAGNSLGGLIAARYAANRPDVVQKVVLLDPAGYPVKGAKGSLGFTLGKTPLIGNLLTIVTPKSVVRKSLEDAYGNTSLVTDGLVEQYYDMTCREGNRKALLARLRKESQIDTAFIASVQQPVFIIWGSEDQLIPVAHAYKFERDLPNSSLIVLQGVGHVPMEESPGLVVPLVREFLHPEKGVEN